MRKRDVVSGGVLAGFSLSVLIYARSLPTMPGLDYGPGTFPAVIAAGLLVGAVLLVLSGLRGSDALPVAEAARQSPPPQERQTGGQPFLSRVALALLVPAACAAYVWLVPTLGFPLVSFALLWGLIVVLHGRPALAAAVAAAATAVLWYGFSVVLKVPLEIGTVWGG